jgi:hypothetical protein
MKTLADGAEVSARTYYYLLDFNDRYNWEYMYQTFDKRRLCDLTIEEYRKLFEHATDVDKVSLI